MVAQPPRPSREIDVTTAAMNFVFMRITFQIELFEHRSRRGNLCE
jgi:hypothetical protein